MEPPLLVSARQSDTAEARFTKAFRGIASLIQSYQEAGAKLYQDNPEALSAARLSVLELWVTVDSSAIQLVPLLQQYDAGFRSGLLDGLVLPKGEQLRRLARVEDYLEQRRASAGSNGPPWRFHDGKRSWSKTCFAVCYVDSSPHHQRLHRNLVEVAHAVERRVARRLEVIARWKEVAKKALLLHSQYPASYYTLAWTETRQSRTRLQHGLYLRSLFWRKIEAKAVIFEADAPPVFTMWREITRTALAVFCDVSAIKFPGAWRHRWTHLKLARKLSRVADELSAKVYRPPGRNCELPSAEEFDELFSQVEEPLAAIGREIYLISDDSPDASEPTVNSKDNFFNRQSYASGGAVPEVLRQWICGTAHTPNEVLAARPQCPPTMAPDEFRAFGDLRAGRQLQWHNILLQLTVPSLNITRPEVFCLIMQAAHEVGPRGGGAHAGGLRSTHGVLGEARFGNALLGGLEDALSRVADQRDAEVALCVLVSLAVRLLSVSPHRQVQGRCLTYLRRLREAGRDRARALAAALEVCDTADEARRAILARRTQLAALACHATFDVGAAHHASVLWDDGEAALLIESAIRVAEHVAPRLPGHADTPVLDALLYRRDRLSYEMEPRLGDRILGGGAGLCLNIAIGRFWPSCRRDLSWSPAPAPHSHVLVSRLPLPGSSLETLPLEYNLLTGSLVIGGAPLTGLPARVREHPTFRLLFGDRALTVVGSYTRSQGMQYLVTSSYHGHRIHLAVLENGWLMVRSEKDGTRYEFIPPETLRRSLHRSLPGRLFDGYAHWLMLDENRVEFRPLANAWQTLKDAGPSSSSCGGYVLELDDGDGHGARLTKVGSAMASVCATSETARAVHRVLRPLESPELVDLAFDRRRRVLSIELPRLRLSFRLAQGQSAVVSLQYAAYKIDEDQSVGTLAGFESKLVLRRSPCGGGTPAPFDARLLLVPAGAVSFEAGPHGRAGLTRIVTEMTTAAAAAGRRVRYHVFRVDATLGCLRDGDGALSSLLLLCHLHAITTHCLPDRLTGRTGTEEALRMLGSVAVQLTDRQLRGDDDDNDNNDHLRRLRRIGGISPLLERDRRSGQLVRWSRTAPPAAQDGAFSRCVAAILGQAGVTMELPPVSDASLVRRAVARTSAYYVVQYSYHGGDEATKHSAGRADDVWYPGWRAHRTAEGYDGEVETCRLARHIVHGEGAAVCLYPPDVDLLVLPNTAGFPIWPGQLAFSTDWLDSPHPIPAHAWHQVLAWVGAVRVRRGGDHVYNLALFLAQLMFAPNASFGIIQLLLTMAMAPREPWLRWFGRRTNYPLPLIDANQKLINASGCRYSLQVMESIRQCCNSLASHIRKLPVSVDRLEAPPAVPHLPLPQPARPGGLASIDDMFTQPAPQPPMRGGPPSRTKTPRGPPATRGALSRRRLQSFLGHLGRTAQLEHERRYVQELRRAAKALGPRRATTPATTATTARRASRGAAVAGPGWGWLLEHVEACRREVANRFTAIRGALGGGAAAMAGEAGRLEPASRPAVTPVMLLERLSRRHRPKLSDGWLRCLVDYALALTALQRAERLATAAATGNRRELAAELRNAGHENWDPVAFPDWLLLEVDMGILIRPIQARVASAMMRPPGRRNHVMQLHMGEGKSSVIVPMVAAALADGSRLVRVVAAKPQSKQILHTLTRALGGLLGRCVYPLPPLARGVGCDANLLARMRAGCVRCLHGGGVVVAQPEHLLSFRLAGVEAALLAGAAAGPLLAMQRSLDRRTRDIVDESDEVFHTRSELIYTVGPPAAVDLGAQRWRLIQNVLALVAETAPGLREAHPGALEVGPGLQEGRFPQVRILTDTGADVLADRLVERILSGGLAGFPHMANPRRRRAREAVSRYVRQPEPAAADVATVEAMFAADELPERPLLLLRGLIAHGVLCFCLRKRWGVDYGRTDTRDPPTGLAVPFRAKGLPSPRSEFGHPDVVVVLTCLSYYYSGLSSQELRASLERLAVSAGGERTYTSWVLPALHSIPRPLHQLGAIDMQDHQHYVRHVFPHLCRLRPAIDYYLADVLFDREMREFGQTLSTSAWSLAEVKPHPTTGFSGTHDAKYLLPLSISFFDLREQRHAKAQVLSYLLRPENAVRDLAFPPEKGGSPAAARSHDPFPPLVLLRLVVDTKPPIRVIIDVGAQIIGLDNAEVARCWLALVPHARASAAVYFDSDETICVVTRDGMTEPFLTSPYVANTASCLVFLDEAHARGTDIRLPGRCRAAVTLGPMLTKDRLVQACMRMRQLGHGHSVIFLVPAEIRDKITALRGIRAGGKIRVADVLAWSVGETWHEARRLIPLWAAQGRQHQRQLLLRTASKGDQYELSRETAAQLLENNGLTLRERYCPACDGQAGQAGQTVLAREAARIQRRCRAFGGRGPGAAAAALQQEQEREREILPERENPPPEPQPLPAQPLEPSLHAHVEMFVRTGTVPPRSAAFMPALHALAGSSVSHILQDLCGPSGLLATADFARTVHLPTAPATGGAWDAYQRPVQWIATAHTRSGTVAVVLSPWEANALMPIFRAGGIAATLHLFAPRTSLATRSAEDLLLYTTPPLIPGWRAPRALMLTLLLFAGQLYLRSYDEYIGMCRLLGVPYHASINDEESLSGAKEEKEAHVFEPAAVHFFLALFQQIRHPSADISRTDLGHILAGDVLLPPSAFSGPTRAQ